MKLFELISNDIQITLVKFTLEGRNSEIIITVFMGPCSRKFTTLMYKHYG